MYDRLEEFDDLIVVGIDAGSRADDSDEYANLRAQLAFGVREWLESGAVVCADEELREDVLSQKYSFDRTGRILIESKDDIKARIGRSPDAGDALANAVYASTGRTGHVVKGL